MAWKRMWIVSYDIADARRLRRTAALAEAVGSRQQKSVFEAALSADERARLEARLSRVIRADEDHVLLHPCCALCRAAILWQGRAPGPDHEPFWIV